MKLMPMRQSPRTNSGTKLGLLMVTAVLGLNTLIPAGPTSEAKATPQEKSCRSQDLPETGLQGEVPKADQDSGRSLLGYCKNMRLIGQNDIGNRGFNAELAWLGNCAYVTLLVAQDHPLGGMAVIDGTNPRRPGITKLFRGMDGAMASQVDANKKRDLVIEMPIPNRVVGNMTATDPQSQLWIYDAKRHCYPERVGTYNFVEFQPHQFRISSDGKTVYAVDTFGFPHTKPVQVIDISDPANPELIMAWNPNEQLGEPGSTAIHDLELNKAGTRAYLNGGGGLLIVDTTDIQERASNPKLKVIGRQVNPSFLGGSTHSAQLAHIDGRKYILGTNELPSGESGCPWGQAWIVDVTNDQKPKFVAPIGLEVNDAENCSEMRGDNATYTSHMVGVDNVRNTKLAFFSWFGGGIRAVDVSEPYRPREIGYYNPGGRSDTVFQPRPPDSDSPLLQLCCSNQKIDTTYSTIRYRKKTEDIWFVSSWNGFQVVKLVP